MTKGKNHIKARDFYHILHSILTKHVANYLQILIKLLGYRTTSKLVRLSQMEANGRIYAQYSLRTVYRVQH